MKQQNQNPKQLPMKRNAFLVEEHLLKATIELLEEMPVRLAAKVLPIIQALKKSQPVEVRPEEEDPTNKTKKDESNIKPKL